MSQRKSRRKTQASLSQPQPSTSRASMMDEDEDHTPLSQISPDKTLTSQEHTLHVSNVVKYILTADQTNMPIVRSAISKATNCHGKNFRVIMNSAQEVLLDVFGYKMVDVDNGKFILINTVKSNFQHLRFEEEVGNRYTVLFLALSHIYMSGGVCPEGSLRNFFISLGILNENDTGVFGNVMKMITIDFVKEKYIEQKDADVLWGRRAFAELSVRSVMEFMGKVHSRNIKTWPQQYEMMLQIEREQSGQPNGVENEVEEDHNSQRQFRRHSQRK